MRRGNVTGAVVFCMVMHGWTNTLMGLFDINENYTYYIAVAALTAMSIGVSIKVQHKKNSDIY